MFKVTQGDQGNSFNVVPADHGELRTDRMCNGGQYVYLPLPICRVPVGYGRTPEQAEKAAILIQQALNNAYPHASTFDQLLDNIRDRS